MEEHFSFSEESISETWTEVTPQPPILDIYSDNVTIEDTFLNGVIDTQLRSSLVSSGDFLTSAEITDVETSWREIAEGEAQEFADIEEFLRDLNSE